MERVWRFITDETLGTGIGPPGNDESRGCLQGLEEHLGTLDEEGRKFANERYRSSMPPFSRSTPSIA